VLSDFATLPATGSAAGLAFDAAGNLYAADFITDEISKIARDGAVSLFASLPARSGLALDSAGNLYERTTWCGRSLPPAR
jgi:hypothetical protein